jgi:hypothetical protein
MLQALPSHIRYITWRLFLGLLFVVVCLPTGSIFGVNVKVLGLTLFIVALAAYLITNRGVLSRGDIFLALALVSAMCFWSMVAIVNGQTDFTQIFLHLKELGSSILIAWLSIFAVRKGLISPERIIAVIVLGMFLLSAMKLALVAGLLLFGIDPIGLVQLVFSESATVAGAVDFGLVRMQFSQDILGSFALFALLAPSVSGIKFRKSVTFLIGSVVLVGSGFFAYSRYVWFIYFTAIFIALIVERKWRTIAATLVVLVVLCIPFYDVVSTIFETRFLSTGTEFSDEGRVHQAAALFAEVKARPVLGKGIGTHTNVHLSNDFYMYGYEMQWLSLLMQFGIVGESGILLLVVASAWDLIKSKHRAKLWVGFLFVLWLLASWTNPYLTSSFAGATFGLFMAIFYRMRSTAPTDRATMPAWTLAPQGI